MNPSASEALFQSLDRELWLVSSASKGRRGGLIATFVSQISLGPDWPRVIVSIAKQHNTCTLIEQSGAFGLHLLDLDQLELVWRFGLISGREVDKFEGLAAREGSCGTPILLDVPGWLDCRVLSQIDAADRTIFLGEVLDAFLDPSRPKLTAASLFERASPEHRRRLEANYQRDLQEQASEALAWRWSRSNSNSNPTGRPE